MKCVLRRITCAIEIAGYRRALPMQSQYRGEQFRNTLSFNEIRHTYQPQAASGPSTTESSRVVGAILKGDKVSKRKYSVCRYSNRSVLGDCQRRDRENSL